jgi:Reverse transcriptase (RNA-dependent DNA polymerase)/Endonuclease-reverse transcriptase
MQLLVITRRPSGCRPTSYWQYHSAGKLLNGVAKSSQSTQLSTVTCTLRCIHFNARSINNKLASLYDLLNGSGNETYEVIFVTESWLDNSIPNSLLTNGNRYNVIRKDRPTRGGGVCLFVRESIQCVFIPLPVIYQDFELICVDIIIASCKQRFICVYCPDSPPSADYMKGLCEVLSMLCSIDYAVTICGDFNMRDINWNNLSLHVSSHDSSSYHVSAESIFTEFITDYGLTQLVDKPTRGQNILDLLLTNDLLACSQLEVLAPFATSDHGKVSWVSWFPNDMSSNDNNSDVINKFNFSNADYLGLNQYLSSINWDQIFYSNTTPDVEFLWTQFKSVLIHAISLFVPLLTQSSSSTKYPSYIRKALNKKKTLWRKRISASGLAAYKTHALHCEKLIKKHHAAIERRILKSNSAKSFYKFVNKKLTSSHSVAPIKAATGEILHTDLEKAEALNQYFCSVFKPPNSLPTTKTPVNPLCPVSPDVDLSYLNVLKALLGSKKKTSSGTDGLPSILWSKIAHSVAYPVSIIFNTSYSSSSMPSDWKYSVVTPLYKKGDPSIVNNYRPISLTSTLAKIMESLIKENILEHVSKHNLLNDSQHGFLPQHSTTSQLLECMHDWSAACDLGAVTDIIYIDISKAFDTVSHSKLFDKLHSFNLSHRTIDWIMSFLNGRVQAVKCNNSISSSRPVSSGLVQGSVLGPILYVLFTNDLPITCAPCTVKMFADDIKIYFKISHPSDRILLQNCLDKIHAWAIECELSFSYEKCQFIQIGYKDTSISYTLGSHHIYPSESVNDLGVTIHSTLKSSTHCVSIVSKANARAKLILKCFQSRNPNNLIRAFKSYVRPLVEYASPVWNPYLKQDIDLIERVQRSFTRKVCVLCNLPPLSYTDRLHHFNLERLELRRLHNDLTEMFKIIKHYTATNLFTVFHFSNTSHHTRGHRHKLSHVYVHKDIFKFSFVNRIVNVWNYLPDTCFNTSLIATFKQKLRRINFDKFLIGRL